MPYVSIPLNGEPYKNEDGIVLVDGNGCNLVNGRINQFGHLHRRWGLKPYRRLDMGTVLGVYHWENKDYLIAVSGEKIYKIDKYGTITNITGAKLQPSGRVTFVEDYDFVYMANGGKIVAYATFLQYLQQNIDHPDLAERSIDGNLGNLDVDYDYTDSTIYMPDEHAPVKVTHLGMIDTYMLMNNKGDDYLTYAEVGEPLNVSALNFFRAESKSDNIQAIGAENGEITAFGTQTIGFYQNDGVSPFSKIGGVDASRGLGGADTLAFISNRWMFLDHEGKHTMLAGRTPQVVSMNYDKELQGIDINSAFAMPISVDGHALYIISSPSNDKCYVYDDKLSRWQGEWASWDTAKADYSRWRGNCYVNIRAWGKHLVGDISNGIIYEMSSDYYKDGDDPIRLEWTSGHVSHGTNRVKQSNRIICRFKRGSATVPSKNNKCRLTWRDDNKPDWSNGREIDLGNVGDTEMVKTLHALGQYRNRQYKLEYSDEGDFICTGLEEEVNLLDR
mgnify:FL=1